jgi:hypothetical protein
MVVSPAAADSRTSELPGLVPTARGTVLFNCDAFATTAIGDHPGDWVDVAGQWLVVDDGGERVLMQMTAPTLLGSKRFASATADASFGDVRVSAHATWSDSECVMARFDGMESSYSVCLGGSESGGPPATWRLMRRGGPPMVLATGPLADPTAPAHDLSLEARGSTLTAIVDGVPMASVTDDAYSTGAVAVSSRGQGSFGRVCVVRL